MSHIEKFADNVATEVLGAAPSGEANPSGWIEIITIIVPVVLEVIKNCQNRSNKRLLSTIRKPGLVNKLRFRRIVRNQIREEGGKWSNRLDDIVGAFEDVVKDSDDDKLMDVIKEAKGVEDDYWLI